MRSKSLLYGTIVLFIFVISKQCSAQIHEKRALDTSAFDKWPEPRAYSVCDDGNYLYYTPFGHVPSHPNVLYVSSTRTERNIQIKNAFAPRFSANSKWLLYKLRGDSLVIMELETFKVHYIIHVASFQLYPKAQKNNWLIYRKTDSLKTLVIRDLNADQESSYAHIDSYFINSYGTRLAMIINSDANHQILQWADLSSGKTTVIWNGRKVKKLIIDRQGENVAFSTVDENSGLGSYAVWYYKQGSTHAERIDIGNMTEPDGKYSISDISQFSVDRTQLFVKLMRADTPKKAMTAVQIEIWSYLNPKTPWTKKFENPIKEYLAVLDIRSGVVLKLENDIQKVPRRFGTVDEPSQDEWLLLLDNSNAPSFEYKWNSEYQCKLSAISSKTGKKKSIADLSRPTFGFLSPSGCYLLFYNEIERNYFITDLTTSVTLNLTKSVKTGWTKKSDVPYDLNHTVNGEPIWFKDDDAVILRDCYNDLWEFKLKRRNESMNLTCHLGKKHDMVFSAAWGDQSPKATDAQMLVCGFDQKTKDEGYYQLSLKGKPNVKELIKGPYRYEEPGVASPSFKISSDSSTYFFERQSDKEQQNIFMTIDNFKTIKPITHFAAQANYNWLSAELFHWKTSTGAPAEGVLYKPENFNPAKKYPLIVFVYERYSNDLRAFPYPSINGATIDVAYYLSHGYLVLKPDIHYTIGKTKLSALDYVVSATKQLSKSPYVDNNNLGIQGHSFGGAEVNYVVSHTNIFKAALSAAGVSDLIGAIGEFLTSQNEIDFMENGQPRMGTTLWQNPKAYIKESPIFSADKVSTPLLMMNNLGDNNVPFRQGIAFFSALRRLGKKAWLLEYGQGNGHTINRKEDQFDYFIRMNQFFDHYLKGTPTPQWMLDSNPTIDTTDPYALAPKGDEPGPGLLRPSEQNISKKRHSIKTISKRKTIKK